MAKHIPKRMCLGCRQMFDKPQLIRITLNSDGIAVVDTPQKIIARGVYLCRSAECVKKAQKKRVLERSFSGDNVSAVYEKVLETVGEQNG